MLRSRQQYLCINTASDFGSSVRSLWARHAAPGVVLETSSRSQPQSNIPFPEILFYISRVVSRFDFRRKLGRQSR